MTTTAEPTCAACPTTGGLLAASSGRSYCPTCRNSLVVLASEDFAHRQAARVSPPWTRCGAHPHPGQSLACVNGDGGHAATGAETCFEAEPHAVHFDPHFGISGVQWADVAQA